MPKIDAAQYENGLAAYRNGKTLRDMVEVTEAMEQVPELEELVPSIMLGFADGLIADLRSVFTSPTFQRTGTRA